MDDLEFRRRILADPNDNSPDLSAARNESIVNRKLYDELLQLDAQLEKTMKVDVPDDLADRILFHQSGQPNEKPKSNRFHMAIAASVALAVGIMIGQFNHFALPSAQAAGIGQIALQHVHTEAPFVNTVDESVSLQQVNAKLLPFGPSLSNLPGHVSYVNHCGFGDKNALHMVMDTPQGKVTVFIVPEVSKTMTAFNDKQMDGIVMPIKNASLIVVGEKGQDVMPIIKSIESDLHWQI
jgi:hypothetical protein